MYKNVLDYTEEELETLSDDDLISLYKEAENKEAFYETEQMTMKILINSLYGALGNKYFPLFNVEIAKAITGNGRYFIQLLGRNVESMLKTMNNGDGSFWLYSDTDAIYYKIDNFVREYSKQSGITDPQKLADYANEFETKYVQPVIQKTVDEFCETLNASNKSVIWAEREVIGSSGVFTAKKKYYIRVIDSEGVRYKEPKLKIMGLEIARSSTPEYTRKKLKESIDVILDKDETEIKKWVKGCEEEYMKRSITEIARNSGVSNLKYNLQKDKSIPIASKASIVYNQFIKSNDLLGEFTEIREDDKIKLIYLNEPNPFNSPVVAWNNEKFEKYIADYVDYKTCWEKFFLASLGIMTKPLGWKVENNNGAIDDW